MTNERNAADDDTLKHGELYVKLDLIKFSQEIKNIRFFLEKVVHQIDMSVLKETGKRIEKREQHFGRRKEDKRADEVSV